MKMTLSSRLLGCLATIIAFPLALCAADYYVAEGVGDDSASGSRTSPWKSIQHAADNARPGDTIIVAPGDYGKTVRVTTSGTVSAPIHFKSFRQHEALLEGFDLDADYIIVEGFCITNNLQNGSGIHAGEAHRKNARKGCQIVGNHIHDVTGTAIYSGTNAIVRDNLMKNVYRGVFANSDTLVENNEIDTLIPVFETKNGKERPKKTQYTFFVGENITFRGNYMHGTNEKYLIEGMGACFFSSYDAWIYGPSKNILFEGNRCFNATHASEPTGTAVKKSSGFTYRNNLFVNTVYVGILCKSVSEITVENNTFINCGAYPVWFQTKRETQGSVVRNNIIAYYDREAVVQEYGWKPAESAIRNNLYPGDPVETGNNLIWKSVNRDYAASDFVADPMFVDPANGDFRLRPGSPAIDAGATLSHVDTDIRGVSRPQGSAFDIGCYEYSRTEDAQ